MPHHCCAPLTAGARQARQSPCPNCPWWKATDAAAQIPNFEPGLMQQLYQTCQDDGQKVMACHKSVPGNDTVCAGWAIAYGADTVGMRMAVLFDDACLDDYDHSLRADLWPDFDAMLIANDVERPPRNRRTPPGDHNV